MKNFHGRTGKTLLYFGPNSTTKLKKHLVKYNDRVLIVTGRASARKSGALKDILEILGDLDIHYEIYEGVSPNPMIHVVREIADMIKKVRPTKIIAIGGGSVIDATKLASVASAENTDPIEYLKNNRIPKKHIPLIAVNLTHGTGTEVDSFSVINIPETQEKIGIIILYPEISIDNPIYTLTLPRKQTIITSIDAFYHALESYISNHTSPYVRDLDEKAVGYIKKYLPRAIEDPGNITSRYWLLYASMIAGIAIDHGFTYVIHAAEHGLSGVKPELEHGVGLGILGPIMIKYIYKAMPDDAYQILRILNPTLKPDPEDAEKASQTIKNFQEENGFNYTLRDYGFTEEDVKTAIEIVWPSIQKRMGEHSFIKKEDLVQELIKTL